MLVGPLFAGMILSISSFKMVFNAGTVIMAVGTVIFLGYQTSVPSHNSIEGKTGVID